MIDLQASFDSRNVPLERVGVKDLRYPIKVLQPNGKLQDTIAKININIDLHPEYRGAHMSRFIEIVETISGQELTVSTIPEILEVTKIKLNSKTAEIDIHFPYFIPKSAPVSHAIGMVDYQCNIYGRLKDDIDFRYGVTVPVTSLCPCSKEISNYGAHNQRCLVSLDIRTEQKEIIWFEELIQLIESSASAPIYSILKREDEKFVTEQAYNNPVFVEDIVRDLSLKIERDNRIIWFKLEAISEESIHNHNAFAATERTK